MPTYYCTCKPLFDNYPIVVHRYDFNNSFTDCDVFELDHHRHIWHNIALLKISQTLVSSPLFNDHTEYHWERYTNTSTGTEYMVLSNLSFFGVGVWCSEDFVSNTAKRANTIFTVHKLKSFKNGEEEWDTEIDEDLRSKYL